jgi:chemotaxis protein methyltransferase CheR
MSDESWMIGRNALADGTRAVDGLSAADFGRIAALVTEHSGIRLPAAKRSMLEGRVRKRARAAGYPTISAYCAHLFRRDGIAAELTHLVDAATTNKTDFFREPQHYQLLETRMLADLLERRRGQSRGKPMIKLWSAACSNGAEAYTAAMVLADAAVARRDFEWSILGTDISRGILSDARQAVYPAEMIAPVPAAKQARYLMHGRCEESPQKVRIVPELRRLVRFAPLNLMDRAYPFDSDFDVVMLRNVLIYFSKEDQQAVVTRLTRHLRRGGFLLLGHAESMIGSELGLRQVAPATFQVP